MEINIQHLEDIVGADNVTDDSETCKAYSRDVSSLPKLAGQILDDQFDAVAQPVTVESLQKLVTYSGRRKIPLTIRGNGTSGWGGSIPTRGGICVSLTHMSRVLNLDDFGLTVTVEAGITWRELLIFLNRLGSTLPVYPSSATAATVGGFVASGGFGIGSARYGDISSQIVGVEAVLLNGKLVRVGNMVLTEPDQDAARAKSGTKWFMNWLERRGGTEEPDPMSYLIGTYGVFGIITKVTMKIIPRLQLLPFAVSFETIDDLVRASIQIISEAEPYHLRFLADNYTSKLRALTGLIFEDGKFILSGALLDTIFQNEESIETIKGITETNGGVVLDIERAQYHWDERLFPLRIKRLGPSLVPAEVLVPTAEIPSLLHDVRRKLGSSRFAVEGTMDKSGLSSFLVWILDDERKTVSYTIGWHRSFDIAALAKKHGGSPYAIALWNSMHAKEFYGEQLYEEFRALKKEIDPQNLTNTMKVFGGRVAAAWPSLILGFLGGFIGLSLALWIGPEILGASWLRDALLAQPVPFMPLPLIIFIALLGGLLGFSVIKFMSLKQAMTLVLPLLKTLGRVIGK
ncbi:MAG: FAD-binding oxidoreductase [Candidatus Thorarchaeota archaeon]|nr:MAG: FAD-binding oxidoreductase [Candidatus Thorarchaeota archaeon]